MFGFWVFVFFRVVILDHHKTAMEALGGRSFEGENVSKVIDMERSGATIAFDYFKHKLLESGKNNYDEIIAEFDRVRRVFEYIEDGDLWRWRLENSKAFNSGLKDSNLEFNAQLNPSLFDQVPTSLLLFLFIKYIILELSLGNKNRSSIACSVQ